MSDFEASNNGGSAPPSRAPSPTPSQKERTEARRAADDATKAANAQLAREVGWTDTTPMDYNRMNGDGEWYGSGGKYEWTDDFGEIAPDVPELEAILFGNEDQARAGEHMEALNVKVKVDGPFAIKPINNVSITPTPHSSKLYTPHSSPHTFLTCTC